MDKKDLVTLIKAHNELNILDNAVRHITQGTGIDATYTGLFGITDIILKYSNYKNDTEGDLDEFFDILDDTALTPEEKYNRICR